MKIDENRRHRHCGGGGGVVHVLSLRVKRSARRVVGLPMVSRRLLTAEADEEDARDGRGGGTGIGRLRDRFRELPPAAVDDDDEEGEVEESWRGRGEE